MATKRDAQTLLIGFRSKYPRYKDVDDATLLSAIQKKYPQYRDISLDSIPYSENILQKAVKESMAVASSVAYPLPQLASEFSRFPSAGMFEAGSKAPGVISGKEKLPSRGFSIPEPETTVGKVASFVAPMVLPSLALIKGGTSVGKWGLKNLRTGPVKKQINTLENLILASKGSEAPVKQELNQIKSVSNILASRSKREIKNTQNNFKNIFNSLKNEISLEKTRGVRQAESISYESKSGLKNRVQQLFDDANDEFGARFSNLESSMTDEDIAQIIENAAREVGAQEIAGSPGNILKNFSSKYGPKITEGEINLNPRIYTKEEVQAITKKILSSLPDSRTKAIFNQNLLNALPETIPGLRELKASHAPIYNIAKESKEVTKGAIKRIGTGSASELEEARLMDIEGRTGTNFAQRARESRIANESRLNDLKSRLQLEEGNLASREKSLESKLSGQSHRLSRREREANKKLLKSQQEIEVYLSKIDKLKNRLEDIKWNQAATLTGAGLIGMRGFLNKIFDLEK